MGYVFTLKDAQRYDGWFDREPGRTALAIERDMLRRVWAPACAQRILDVGCGSGVFTQWFREMGHQVTGIEPSTYMLDLARRRLGPDAALHRGYAEDLPFHDDEFDTVVINTTLEFVDDPVLTFREAARVARKHVLLGVLNRYSLISVYRSLETLWRPTVFRHARFYGVHGLHMLAAQALPGQALRKWRTCLVFPPPLLTYLRWLEGWRYFQMQPFGHFIAMRVDLRYTLQAAQNPLVEQIPPGRPRVAVPTCRFNRRRRPWRDPSWDCPEEDVVMDAPRRCGHRPQEAVR